LAGRAAVFLPFFFRSTPAPNESAPPRLVAPQAPHPDTPRRRFPRNGPDGNQFTLAFVVQAAFDFFNFNIYIISLGIESTRRLT